MELDRHLSVVWRRASERIWSELPGASGSISPAISRRVEAIRLHAYADMFDAADRYVESVHDICVTLAGRAAYDRPAIPHGVLFRKLLGERLETNQREAQNDQLRAAEAAGTCLNSASCAVVDPVSVSHTRASWSY
jgi:hypothetical protein